MNNGQCMGKDSFMWHQECKLGQPQIVCGTYRDSNLEPSKENVNWESVYVVFARVASVKY